MTRTPWLLLLSALILGACASEPEPTESTELAASTAAPRPELTFDWIDGREVHEPRLVVDRAGAVLLAWREKAPEGSNVYVARRLDDGSFTLPVRANDEPDTVESYPHDEMRAAVATGPDGRLALGWTDGRGQARIATSADGGVTFAPSTRLEQVEERAYRGFPDLAYDDEGVLHAVWIDSRFAEGMQEEPADLFYARIAEGVVTELNLTAEQEPTVCGCCRPNLEIVDGRPRVLFRNSTSDGYRDIFAVSGNPSGGFSPPERVGAPLWKLRGCPMSGPMAAGETVLWPDGSTGRKLIMTSPFGSSAPVPLFAETDTAPWKPRLSPRPVVSPAADSVMLLLPGQVSSRLLTREGGGDWVLAADDLPPWASSAYLEGASLVVIGAVDGELLHESRVL